MFQFFFSMLGVVDLMSGPCPDLSGPATIPQIDHWKCQGTFMVLVPPVSRLGGSHATIIVRFWYATSNTKTH